MEHYPYVYERRDCMRIAVLLIMFVLFLSSPTLAAPKTEIIHEQPVGDASSVTLSLARTPTSTDEVMYRIWRTADGPSSAKSFTSSDKQSNFSFVLATEQFESQRGQYEIEAVRVKKKKPTNTIAKTTVTFQQYVPILMYHSIAEFKGSGLEELYVSPANFEAQIRYLKEHNYTPITFDRWNEINTVNKPVCITFDDGYENNINAYEIFKKMNSERFRPTGTIFVVAGFVGRHHRLTADQLRDMSQSGFFSIQSHTMHHPDLPEVKNIQEELEKSKDVLEAITGKPVIAFAYPYGHYNKDIMQQTMKYYQFAVTVRHGLFIEKGAPDEYYTMPRQFVQYSTTIEQFANLLQPYAVSSHHSS